VRAERVFNTPGLTHVHIKFTMDPGTHEDGRDETAYDIPVVLKEGDQSVMCAGLMFFVHEAVVMGDRSRHAISMPVEIYPGTGPSLLSRCYPLWRLYNAIRDSILREACVLRSVDEALARLRHSMRALRAEVRAGRRRVRRTFGAGRGHRCTHEAVSVLRLARTQATAMYKASVLASKIRELERKRGALIDMLTMSMRDAYRVM